MSCQRCGTRRTRAVAGPRTAPRRGTPSRARTLLTSPATLFHDALDYLAHPSVLEGALSAHGHGTGALAQLESLTVTPQPRESASVFHCSTAQPAESRSVFFVSLKMFCVYFALAGPTHQSVFFVFSGLAGFIGPARPDTLQLTGLRRGFGGASLNGRRLIRTSCVGLAV